MTGCIEIRGLCKSFKGFSLNDIDMDIPVGTVTGLIGNNGAGKTTLIKCLTGAVIPDSGEIRFPDDGMKSRIAVVFDDCHLPRELNGAQISSVMKDMVEEWDPDSFRAAMHGFEIPLDKKVKAMSTGMMKKLQIAVARAQNPRIIILDEPTAGLDPAARDEFLDDVLRYIQDEGRTVLISSHITSDLEKIADYVTFIHDGSLEFSDEKDAVMERYGVMKCGSESDLRRMGDGHIVAIRRNDFGVQALIDDRAGIAEAYPEAIIDPASLDDILVFMIRGERE